METARLGISVDDREVVKATEALNALATAAERASKALDDLGNREHNGIKVNVVGALATVDIAPSK